MNTPAHAIINLLVLSRNPSHAKTASIIGGALLPDLVIVAFYAWRFASPISHWDPAHHGQWASLVEFACVLAASIFMYWYWVRLRPWVAGTFAIYLLYWIYVVVVWM